MQIELVYLAGVFAIIIVLLTLKRPLYQAILGGIIVTAVLYRIPLFEIVNCTTSVITTWKLISVVISLFLIMFLQQMMEVRNLNKQIEEDMSGLFKSKRKIILSTAVFFGLLPNAASTLFYTDIVKRSTGDYLDKYEQAFVTSWFRHIPESTMPTYSTILLFSALSGVSITNYIVYMIIPILMMIFVGYYPYITKLPKISEYENDKIPCNRKKAFVSLLSHIWPIALLLILILGFGISVVTAVLVSIFLTAVIYKFKLQETGGLFKAAFKWDLLLNSFLCLMLNQCLSYVDVLKLLPDAFAKLPIPTYLIFVLIFFFGALVSGSGIVAIGVPLAFAALQGGTPLMMLLMSTCHAASQVSPTHICVIVAAQQYGISLGSLIRRILPRTLMFIALVIIYYNILLLF